MSTHDEDFWGSEATWSSRPPRKNAGTRTDQLRRIAGRRRVDPDPSSSWPDHDDAVLRHAGLDEAVLDADDDVGVAVDPSRIDVDRTGPIEVVRSGWNRLLGSGANATREHGIVRPVVPPDSDPAAPAPAPAPAADFALADSDTDAHDAGTIAVPGRDAPTEWHATMFDDLDDELGDDAESQFAAYAAADFVDRTSADRTGVDPTVARVGAVAVLATLLLPFAFGFGSSDDSGDVVQTALGDAAVAPALIVPGTDDGVAAGDVSAPTAASAVQDVELAANIAVADTAASASAVTELVAGTVETKATQQFGTMAQLEGSSDVAQVDTAIEVSDASAANRLQTCAIDYDIVAGDFWIRIADGAGVELNELLEVNGASTSTPLFPGASICLPAGSTTPPPPTTAAPITTEASATTAAPATTAASTTTAAPATTAAPTTTAAPATTAAPTTVPPNSNASAEQVKQIIRDIWPDDLEDRAIEIAYRESTFVPTARNYCCHGVFQMYWEVHKGWLDDFGIYSINDLYDPVANTKAAYALYQSSGGWGPWGF